MECNYYNNLLVKEMLNFMPITMQELKLNSIKTSAAYPYYIDLNPSRITLLITIFLLRNFTENIIRLNLIPLPL